MCFTYEMGSEGLVYKADGAIVPGSSDRNGQRYTTAGTGKHGGKRVKNTVAKDMGWVDDGALEAMRENQHTMR